MSDNRNISLVINTLNEESNIADCINSAINMVDEVVVCDMWSDDGTAEIAERMGAKVIRYKRIDYVEPARHYAISQASNEWILVLDADERMTDKLGNRLIDIAAGDEYDVVQFWCLFWYFGDWVRTGDFFPGVLARFFKKRAYLETYKKEEEYVHHNFHEIRKHNNKLILSSDYYIKHYAYPTIESYYKKTIGKYARIEADQYHKKGRKFSYFRLFADPVYHILRNVYKSRLRGGTRFFILTMLKAFYRFSVWANLWVLEDEDMKKMSSMEAEKKNKALEMT